MRDLDRSVFEIGVFSNRWINVAFLASLVLQLAVVKVPFLQSLFGFAEISYGEFFVITAAASAVLWAGELYKFANRRIAQATL